MSGGGAGGDAPDLRTLTDPARLAALLREGLLDAPPAEGFDRLTRMAADLVGAPFALVTLVDADRQFFASRVGGDALPAETRETPLSHSFCQYVVAGEAPLVVADARAVPWLRDNGAVSDLGVVAYAGFPLYARDGSPIGSFCVLDEKPREWTERDQALLRDFAGLAQSELDLRAARDDAWQASVLLTRLRNLADATASARGLAALLEDLVAGCAPAFAADLTVIELLDGQGELRRRAVHGRDELDAGVPLRLGAGFSADAGTAEQAIAIADAQSPEQDDELRATGMHSLLAAPLIADGRLLGAVYVGAWVPGAYSELDRQLLAVAADRFAAAITRAEIYERDHQTARTLVAALQPEQLPEVPGVRLVARYQPAERGLGGDWYDAFTLPGGVLGVAMGDVVGHGIDAAAEAVRLRNALRGSVLSGHTPAQSVAALNAYAAGEPGAYASTLLYMELDAATRHLRWASAGHLPGVVAEAGRGERLGAPGGPPLGVMAADTWPVSERTLAPGARVVLFTDGLVERRTEPLDAGIDRVVRATATAADLERLCAVVLAQAPAPRFDDLALLALELD